MAYRAGASLPRAFWLVLVSETNQIPTYPLNYGKPLILLALKVEGRRRLEGRREALAKLGGQSGRH